MNRNTIPVVLVIVVFVCVALVFATGRGKSRHGNHASDRDLVAAIDRVAAAQTEMSQRLERLEYRVGVSGNAGARPMIGNFAGPAAVIGVDQNGGNLTPAQRAALLANSAHELDDQLVRDPLSAQWASANEKVIGNFLDKDNLARQQLPAPRDAKSECHSHLCRISMVFADEAQATQTQAMLLVEIAAALPNAQTLLLPRPDGSVEMVVYAGDAQAFRKP
jgi:hypothetical protein